MHWLDSEPQLGLIVRQCWTRIAKWVGSAVPDGLEREYV